MTMANTTVSSPRSTGVSLRKTNKPLMEKRRRARINDSLTQLKSLVIQSSKKDSSQFNKLEKADILELTVKHLRNLQEQHQQHVTQTSNSASSAGKYQAGFMECANEVIRYLEQSQSFNDDTKSRVVHHLANCIQLSTKLPIGKPTQTSTTDSSMIPSGYHSSNPQFANGHVIQIINNPNIKSSNVSSFPGLQSVTVTPVSSTPTHIPVSATPVAANNSTPSSQPPCYIKYTQPLQIQIPPALCPVLINSKAAQHQKSVNQPQEIHKTVEAVPQIIPHLVHSKQEPLLLPQSPPHPQDKYMSTLPYRTCQKPQTFYPYEEQYSDFTSRSRTYSLTSSSSESELSSPLNLSQSPQYYDHREIGNKYPSPGGNHYYHTSTPSDSAHSATRDGLHSSQCPSSNFTSVIVDGRRTADSHALKYINFFDEERHFIRHEGSSSPASSVGEERLWRPW